MPWLGEANERAFVGEQNNSVMKCRKTNQGHYGDLGCTMHVITVTPDDDEIYKYKQY